MEKFFLYTKIEPEYVQLFKATCHPYTKDLFGAKQEQIAHFSEETNICLAAISFLNAIYQDNPKHNIKLAIVQGAIENGRPTEPTIRLARIVHEGAPARSVCFLDDFKKKIEELDAGIEDAPELKLANLKKSFPLYSLTRFANLELSVDPADLFDFSQVALADAEPSPVPPSQVKTSPVDVQDSTESMPEPKVSQRAPFENSGSTIELDHPKGTTGPVPPAAAAAAKPIGKMAITQASVPTKSAEGVTSKIEAVALAPVEPESKGPPSSPRLDHSGPIPVGRPFRRSAPEPSVSQLKSVLIVLGVIITIAGVGIFLANRPKPERNVYTFSQKLDVPLPSDVLGNKVMNSKGVEVGYFNIHSTPTKADVWIDGKLMPKKTPIDNLKMNAKEKVLIEVGRKGYEKVSKKVELEANESLTVVFDLPQSKDGTPVAEEPTTPPEPTTKAPVKSKTATKKPTTKKKSTSSKPSTKKSTSKSSSSK